MRYFSIFLFLLLASAGSSLKSQVDPGFSKLELKNIDGTVTSLQEYAGEKPLVLIFTSIHCVYAKKYEARIAETVESYRDKVQFLLINSNDPELSPEDGYQNLALRAKEKPFPTAYLVDPQQILASALAVKKAPEAFVFRPVTSEEAEDSHTLVYRGAIDDNPLQAERVSLYWLRDAIGHTLDGNEESIPSHQVKGCNIKQMIK